VQVGTSRDPLFPEGVDYTFVSAFAETPAFCGAPRFGDCPWAPPRDTSRSRYRAACAASLGITLARFAPSL